MNVQDLPLVLTPIQVSSLLNLSRGTTYERLRRGEIPSVRLGNKIRISRDSVLALLGVTAPEEAPATAKNGPMPTEAKLKDIEERLHEALCLVRQLRGEGDGRASDAG